VVPGTINHLWHGDIRNRAYNTRWKIVYAFQIDPDSMFNRNSDGLDVWSPVAKRALRHSVALHFTKRNEDRDQPLPPRWKRAHDDDDDD